MTQLVLKDLRISMPFFALLLTFYLLHAPVNFVLSAGYLPMAIALTLLLAIGPVIIDWRYETEPTLASLPVSRATIVRGRHLTALVALVLGGALCFGYAALLDGWIQPDTVTAARLLSLEAVLLFLLGVTFPLALFFPACFRWGPGRAIATMTVLLFLMWIAAFALSPGPAMESGNTGDTAAPARELLSPVERHWVLAAHRLHARLGTPAFSATGAIVVIFLSTASLAVSTRCYARRDL